MSNINLAADTEASNLVAAIIPYCERLSNGMEPLNTASNLAFLLAVAYSLPFWLRLNSSNSPALIPQTLRYAMNIVVMLPAVIGIGSGFFHAMPSTLTHALDLGPICLFAILTTVIFLTLNDRSKLTIAAVLFIWITATIIAAQWPEVLAHSLFYVPTVGLLLALSVTVKGSSAHHSTQRRLLLLASLTFATALIFRALDLQICVLQTTGNFAPGQSGTHTIWHLLTALTSVFCLRLLFSMISERYQPKSNN